MEQTEFKQKLSRIRTATSITGKKYHSIHINGDSIHFIRENKTNLERISVEELYELFTKENSINTAIAKSYISGRVQSPAVAILNQFNTISTFSEGTRKAKGIVSLPFQRKKPPTISKYSDEVTFFKAFSEVVGLEYLYSKSLGKPINSRHIFLSKGYKDYLFKEEVNICYLKILKALKSTFGFTSASLSHYVDGLVINHPILESRIIEFDEEQHFTPARRETLDFLSQILRDNYFSQFRSICIDKKYLDEFVLKKHRIKSKLQSLPTSFAEWLEKSNETTSNYIGKKKSFEFLGGRIAQRAYYDCLRDTAHLSKKNRGLKEPFRFAKKTFEDKENSKFAKIPYQRIKEIIIEELKLNYSISINGI
ncbi:hypothetical protein [Xanthovirga aplysinae]|uniref:hypothetical protein n=1 Tax=Xanthovirga aplysinae TaxID=2529853 RepID=UPI0012BC9F28|nr:hypothetical protein [Xanthovirga aplysinae]MTI31095.1 hypothetical protein [Xanthovirga aplysinae]